MELTKITYVLLVCALFLCIIRDVSSLAIYRHGRHQRHQRFQRSQQCRQPSTRKLLRLQQRAGLSDVLRPRLHESFALLDQSPFIRNITNIDPMFIDKQYIHIDGNITCPRNIPSLHRETAQVCPHYHVMEHDRFRIPDTMVQAECRCTNCLSQIDSNEDNQHSLRECKKIYYYARVLRVTDCRRNVFVYNEVWEPIVVGCQCVVSSALPIDNENNRPPRILP